MNDAAPGQQMITEIREQPEAIARLLDEEMKRVGGIVMRRGGALPKFVCIAARGTSDHAAVYMKYLFETLCGVPVALAAPSVITAYGGSLRAEGGLFVGISQSGEAADVLAVIEDAKRNGGDTLALTNVADSPLATMAAEVIPLHAGPETAVAATKTYMNSLAAALLLVVTLKGDDALRTALASLPELVAEAIRGEKAIREQAEQFKAMEECCVLGRGYDLANAHELSLKLRETCYMRAQPFATPDFVHGPIAVVEEGYPVFFFANEGAVLRSVMEVMAKVEALKAKTVVIGNAGEPLDRAGTAFPVNRGADVPEPLSPLPAIAAGQILSCALSVMKGVDPDQPRGLNKVTITR